MPTHFDSGSEPKIKASYEFTAFEKQMMALAIELASKGQYSTTPNPIVGCVIVDDNQTIVGQGFHQRAGEAHAEVNALAQAGELAHGTTAFVTLEPCAHTGRTGPCALALVEAGVSEVVVACTDPNPLVAGKGIAILKNANIKVRLGLLELEAQTLNRYFFHRLNHKRPFVTIKLAASIDGKTALENGESKWITGPDARADVQIERARACAILSGADTVLHDNPQLNVRPETLPIDVAQGFALRQKQPLRVIVDGQNRLNSRFQVLNDGHATVVYNHVFNVNIQDSTSTQVQLLSDDTAADTQDARQTTIGSDKGHVSLKLLLNDLADKNINYVWVEAGANLTGALFDAGLVDRVILYQAPKLLGSSARGLTHCESPSVLAKAMTGKVTSLELIGQDVKMTVDF
jgi:diaminohydroxyphosphoribosylaminopyrimidine deaminase/5-amino-6-(5-phosphoribosylamino)uracil reductase